MFTTDRVSTGRAVSQALRIALPVLLLAGCGEKTANAGRPDVEIGPVAPLEFVFRNPTASPLYVSWGSMRAPIQVVRDAKELQIDPGCAPKCGPACACEPCPSPQQNVMRVDAGADLKVTWQATRFEFGICGTDAGCACAEAWPATYGSYSVSLAASTGVVGGTPDPVDPRLLHNATVDATAAACTANAAFELVGGAEVIAPFVCQ